VQNNETKTRMDNQRTVGGSALRGLVGEQPSGDRILEAIAAGNAGGSKGGSAQNGRSGWEKQSFLGHLEVAARQNGTWIDDVSKIAGGRLALGSENEVSVATDGTSVVKLNNLALLEEDRGQGFDSFVNRLNAHNSLFPDVPYRIIGFAENSAGEVCVVLEQPYVRNPKEATREQINRHLTNMGFKRMKLSDGLLGWSNGKYDLWDIEPRNVLVDSKGNLRFIDTVVYSAARPQILPEDLVKNNDAGESNVEIP
jgi:hypothetical protein